MNSQLLTSTKHSLTCAHLNVELEMPACVSRIKSMVWTFSSIDSHFASTGELGRKKIKRIDTKKVRMTQMMCSHFHDLRPPTSVPASSSWMSL